MNTTAQTGSRQARPAEVDEAARRAVASACPASDAGELDAVDGVQAALVASPTTADQVAELMRACAAHDLAVVVRGHGTKLTWGRPPERADVIADLSGMDQVLDHAAGDLVAATQAGTRLADLQKVLAEQGQRLSVDETVPGASIGGTLATATSGPTRLAVGTPRDLLIGITVVRADGVVAKAGGRVVKNVAGYDLGKLMVGSFGTLAVVVDAHFRLHPLPAERRHLGVPIESADHAYQVAQAVLHAQVVPAAVEVDWPSRGAGTLTVQLAGIPEGVAGRTATALELLGDAVTEDPTPPEWWGSYPWMDTTVDAIGARATALKLTFALSGLPAVLAAARDTPGAPVTLRGSAGVGVVYGAIAPDCPVEAVREAVGRLRDTCTAHGGSLVVLDAASEVKQEVDTWGPVSGLDLMRRVKHEFDPGRRLAPGRFVGGI
ncbi:MAG TPA: FAD-binding oxidoreductase [Nocardioidaceae bacterium]|nr:FAD-binding oxidoreductase [Nocardioidaceae bacterium]